MSSTIEDLNRRIASLERTLRFLLLALGVGVAGLVVAAATKPSTYQASAFQLISEDGSIRGELAVQGGQPVLQLKDENGINRVSLFHEADASGIYVRDSEGVTRVGVAQFAHGGGGVALHGPDSKGAAVLYLKGAGSLRFIDAEGAVTNEVLGVHANGSGK